MKISIIVPCYNEQEALPLFYEELDKVTKQLSSYDFEMLFIDDGSKDKTMEEILKLANKDERVKYISFSRNFGKESAMYAGFCNVTGDYAAVMDADMQDPPSLLPDMIKILEEGEYDSVATRRVSRKGEPLLRSLFAKMFYKIMNMISDTDLVSGARDFRLMKREMVDAIVNMCESSRFSKGIFGWIGFKTYWMEYKNVERVAGKTKWNFFSLFKYSIDGIVSFSVAPLKLCSLVSTLVGLGSLGLFIYALVQTIAYGASFMGMPSLMSLVLFMASLQIFLLGIVGHYVGKTYNETKKRPHYIVAKTNKKDVVKK